MGLALKSLICKYPLKQIRATCRKMLQTRKKYILRKMGFKFFCELCGVKRGTMSFWRKQKLQNKIICFIFFKKTKALYKISSRNCAFSIHNKIYMRSFVCHDLEKYFLQLEHHIHVELLGHL